MGTLAELWCHTATPVTAVRGSEESTSNRGVARFEAAWGYFQIREARREPNKGKKQLFPPDGPHNRQLACEIRVGGGRMAQLFVALTMRGKKTAAESFSLGFAAFERTSFFPPGFTRGLLNAAFVRRYNNTGLISVCNEVSKTSTALCACCKCQFTKAGRTQTQHGFHLDLIYFIWRIYTFKITLCRARTVGMFPSRYAGLAASQTWWHDGGAFVLHLTEAVNSLSNSQERI